MYRRRIRRRARYFAFLVTATVVLLMSAAPSRAEHEADHRYNVRGYILNDAKKAQPEVPVTLLLGNQVVGSARSNDEGYYSIRAHLHDSEIGRALTVRAGDRQADIRMTATPRDVSTPRIHHVNFIGGEVVEEELAGGVPAWAYLAAAPVVLWAAYYAGSTARRRIRRVKKAQAKAERKGKRKGKR